MSDAKAEGHSKDWLKTLDRWIDLMSRLKKQPIRESMQQEVDRVRTEVMRYREHKVLPALADKQVPCEPRPSIGRRKAAQIGQTIGVLAQNQEGRVCAVTDMGRCTWLRENVTGEGNSQGELQGMANTVCGTLPYGQTLSLRMEKDAAWLELEDENGNNLELTHMDEGTLLEQIAESVFTGIAAAFEEQKDKSK